jgi:hypothetical protein
VRVVAGYAFQAGVALAPALAAFQAIGLRFDAGDAFHARELHVPPCGMTGAAEIDRVGGA